MLRKEAKKLITLLKANQTRLLGLVAAYFLVTEVILRFPYFNLYNFDFGWRLFILYILSMIWLRPSYNFLILASILFLLLGQFGEVFGILIYISLLTALIKYLIYRKKAQNV